MNRRITLGIVLLVLAAGLWIIRTNWNSENGLGTLLKQKNYQLYDFNGDYLHLSFEYPASWKLRQESGKMEKYEQALLLGPRNTEDTYSAAFVVQGFPVRKGDGSEGRFKDAAQLRKNYTSHLYAKPRFSGFANLKIDGVFAESVTAVYTMPPPMQPKLKNVEIPLKSKAVFMQNGDTLYGIIYTADVREFANHEYAFDHLVKSIRFKKPS